MGIWLMTKVPVYALLISTIFVCVGIYFKISHKPFKHYLDMAGLALYVPVGLCFMGLMFTLAL